MGPVQLPVEQGTVGGWMSWARIPLYMAALVFNVGMKAMMFSYGYEFAVWFTHKKMLIHDHSRPHMSYEILHQHGKVKHRHL